MRPGESKIPSHGRMNVHQANSKRGQKKFREERWPSFAIIDAIIPCSLLLSWLQTQTILLTCFSLLVFFVRAAVGVASPLVVQACFNHLRIRVQVRAGLVAPCQLVMRLSMRGARQR